MFEIKEKNKPFLILLITVIILVIVSFLPNDTKIAGIPVKPVDLFMDIKPDSLLNFNDPGLAPENTSYDSFKNDLYLSSINIVAGKTIKRLSSIISEFFKFNSAEKLSGNTSQMNYFYDAVKQKGKNIRIAHYGDSEIEGDLVTSDLRQILQQKYGGSGTGFLSINSQDIAFRNTIKHSFSSDWKTNTVFAGGDKSLPLGVAGTSASPSSGSWVKYEVTGTKGPKSYSMVKLYYSNSQGSKIKYSFNNGTEQTAELQSGAGVKELLLSGKDIKSVKIIATSPKQAYFYGVSLESGAGVYVDNFPWRGNGGTGFRDINEKTLSDFNNLLNYKLIILSFGGNMVNAQKTDFSWYENQMIKVIEGLKIAFPKTSIVLVSVGDKSIKKGSSFVTDPSVLKILDAQKKVAEKTNVAFWNMFEAMGGMNSMDKWVRSNPPLAFKDYTHVTLQGAAKIAELLSKAIIK